MSKMKKSIAYILWEFPLLSETFISNEILFLNQKHKLPVTIFSNKKPQIHKVHQEAQALLEKTTYLPPFLSYQTIQAALYFSFVYPLRVFRVLFLLLKMIPFRSPRVIPYFLAQSGFCLTKAFYVSKKIMANKPTHLHSHYAQSAAFITLLTSQLTGVPYSFTMHAHDIFTNPNKRLIVCLIKKSQFAVTISQFNKAYLARLDPSCAEKIHVIHCGIDLSRFHPAERTSKASEKIQLLSVARLVGKKGIPRVVRALAQLDKKEALVYKIIGTGPQENELRELIQEKNLSDFVRLMGAQTSSVVKNELLQTDVFVLPCQVDKDGNMDGIPVALMEAMAMEIPVLSTRLSGIPELVKDGAGLLSDPDDEEALLKHLQTLISMKKEEREEMGKIGRRIIEEEFNIETETKKLGDLF
ncbi:MAG: colanic acid biosynthesis glycosyltransferase WcaL [Calditrichaeota bacterium]|nr:colanic acid biosynthesis glycosyltransferase WcaL [Calditrichota bacterium]